MAPGQGALDQSIWIGTGGNPHQTIKQGEARMMALDWGSEGEVGTEEAAAKCASAGVGSTVPQALGLSLIHI